MFEEDGSLLAFAINQNYAWSTVSTITHIRLVASVYRNTNAYISWIKVRKYASSEPVWGTPGMEIQKNIPPVANFTYTPTNPTSTDIIHFTDTSTDADGTIVSWWWGFGDGYYSDLKNPVHCYYTAGNYNVKLTVMDNDGAHGTIQKTIDVTIHFNTRPATPVKPSGTTLGNPKIKYSYTTKTTDPENDLLYYKWDWGDGSISDWFGPYGSNLTVIEYHAWNLPGIYLVKVKAKDIHDAESGWSESLTVKIQK